MIYKISFTVDRVVPGTVGILRLKYKVEIPPRDFLVARFVEVDSCPGQQKAPVGTRIDYASLVFPVGVIRTA